MARIKGMTVPTQAQLHEEVDRVFRDRYPDAPERLDPDDPDQAALVTAWLEIRDDTVNRWTDDIYYQLFPDGPAKLDPDDPSHATYVEYWIDIRDQIRDDAPPKYDYSAPPNLIAADADPSDLTAILLYFDGPISADDAAVVLWRDGLPSGVELEPFGRESFRLRGLTPQHYLTMEREAADLIADFAPMEA